MRITTVMGLLAFMVGLLMDIFSLLAVLQIPPLDKIQFGERLLLFAGGLILIGLGYIMARNLPQPSVTYEEIPPAEVQEPSEPSESR